MHKLRWSACGGLSEHPKCCIPSIYSANKVKQIFAKLKSQKALCGRGPLLAELGSVSSYRGLYLTKITKERDFTWQLTTNTLRGLLIGWCSSMPGPNHTTRKRRNETAFGAGKIPLRKHVLSYRARGTHKGTPSNWYLSVLRTDR